jgi:hypothetical protein
MRSRSNSANVANRFRTIRVTGDDESNASDTDTSDAIVVPLDDPLDQAAHRAAEPVELGDDDDIGVVLAHGADQRVERWAAPRCAGHAVIDVHARDVPAASGAVVDARRLLRVERRAIDLFSGRDTAVDRGPADVGRCSHAPGRLAETSSVFVSVDASGGPVLRANVHQGVSGRSISSGWTPAAAKALVNFVSG